MEGSLQQRGEGTVGPAVLARPRWMLPRSRTPPFPTPSRPWLRAAILWGLVFLGLMVWNGWMILRLFGPDQPWQRLLNDQPIISGRHPLHLYHGYLGAQSLLEQGTLCC